MLVEWKKPVCSSEGVDSKGRVSTLKAFFSVHWVRFIRTDMYAADLLTTAIQERPECLHIAQSGRNDKLLDVVVLKEIANRR